MELTSPLTTLGSISTPRSFHTARGSPSNGADDTMLSSPVDDPQPEEPTYRDAVQLPHELKSHCQIHLEEQLYTAAIHILSGLLSDGTTTTALQPSHHLPTQKLKPSPALIPPPSQIALLATLIIHPSFTSRAPETSNIHAASHALSYLRGLLSTVGPINANFRAAFTFGDTTTTSNTSNGNGSSSVITTRANGRSGGGLTTTSSHPSGLYSSSEDDSPPPSSAGDALTGPFARSHLLFRRAPDFWTVLGWAFRCAAEHSASRWPHWRVWLGFVVAVLEADFDARLARDGNTGLTGRGKSARPYPMLAQSLVAGYLEGLRRERKNCAREVLRAVFAFSDGENGVSDRARFREVFERETVVGKRKRKRGGEGAAAAAVDLENDRFGDYLDGEEFESDEEEEEDNNGGMPALKGGRRRPGRKTKAEGTAAAASFTVTDGIAETVPFRLRIFRLLSAVSYYLPETFASVDELYEKFTDHVRGLPLPMFRLFVESHPSILPEFVQVHFLRTLIEAMLPPSHPDPADVDPVDAAGTGVTELVMQECFLPFAANKITAEDNAKLSLALESIMWFVYAQIGVGYSAKLRRAVEAGIKAREDKVKRRGTGKADSAEKAAREVLARSARNLRALVDVIAVAGR
ncbi:hypothetical protein C8A01DRAFT_36030 [Parachaetomium inaequale]|uniref:Uncharacterized protein n=1 Tax=Parachaetomium inaequale TaxID=2588326 RepID=A0AAN6SRU6_9PEZI|nr:hypothetical protein C8A01DRAFT_36030 [Parachaetomium inaequale]